MNTLERWDILVQFLDGPLAMRRDIEMLGPTIHIGMNPGPTGFKLEGYRGLDGRQAVITVYSGSSISIAPIGNLQTRVSNDQHVNWNDIHPINGPVYLSEGDVVHLGPPGRGATVILLRARREDRFPTCLEVANALDAWLSKTERAFDLGGLVLGCVETLTRVARENRPPTPLGFGSDDATQVSRPDFGEEHE